MAENDITIITVKAEIDAPIETVWNLWTNSEDIIRWNAASDDWHTTQAFNDLQTNGHFSYRMEAKNGSMGFDFAGIYKTVIPNKQIDYIIGDGRNVSIMFSFINHKTTIIESFEAEHSFSEDQQQKGWQAILDNFKRYAESQ